MATPPPSEQPGPGPQQPRPGTSEQPLWQSGRTQGAPLPRTGHGGGQSSWVSGLALFGGVVMLVDGIFAILNGIMGIAKDQVYVATSNYVFRFNLTAWGWIHLVLGILLVAVGYGILRGAAWGRIAGIFLASLSVIANLLWLPHYPLWSLITIGLGVAVIWALTVYDSDRARA